MADWYPAAKQDVGESGGSFTGGPPKGLLHTTEGSSYAGALGAYRANRSWPHFTVSFEGGRFKTWQHNPISVASRALRNTSGGVQTNRDHVIQIEIVARAATAHQLPKAYLDGLRGLMRWIEQHAGVPRSCGVRFVTGGAGVRLSGPAWDNYSGWLGHQHAPENNHVDPGAIDIAYLLADPVPQPQPVPKESYVYIRRKGAPSGAVYRVGPVLEHVSAEEWNALPDPKPVIVEVEADSVLYRRPKLLDLAFDPA